MLRMSGSTWRPEYTVARQAKRVIAKVVAARKALAKAEIQLGKTVIASPSKMAGPIRPVSNRANLRGLDQQLLTAANLFMGDWESAQLQVMSQTPAVVYEKGVGGRGLQNAAVGLIAAADRISALQSAIGDRSFTCLSG